MDGHDPYARKMQDRYEELDMIIKIIAFPFNFLRFVLFQIRPTGSPTSSKA
ncbi:MAG TPA: hypothetical protein VNA68_02840 [Candidatus Dormibacteraeota bacterium]|nr:hypothetical protein [Candidatus Dormibacteraeota bacterium]